MNRSKTFRRIASAILIFALGAASVWAIPFVVGVVITQIGTHPTVVSATADAAQTLIVLVSVIVAYLAYLASIRTSARQNTLDRIFQEHIDKDVVSHRATFISVRDDKSDKLANYATSDRFPDFFDRMCKDDGMVPGAVPTDKRDAWREVFLKRRTSIFAILNRYETFAIGIETGAIDEDMYRRWWKTALIQDWYDLRSVIEVVRSRSPRAFIAFEALARRWERENGTIKSIT